MVKTGNTADVAERTAMHVSRVSMILNLALSALKLIAGIVASSSAMISDAVHSASDVFSTLIVMVGVKMSGKEADKEHPYGHERMECVAAIILSGILLFTGLGIGTEGMEKITARSYETLAAPGALALAAAVLSIVLKEWMFWYTKMWAEKIGSGALMADAWHHRSDSLSSIGAFVGILGARMGYPVMDALASVVIALFIMKAAYDIFKDAVNKMVDKSCDEDTQQKIRQMVLSVSGVLGIDELITREFGNRIYVDLEIVADGSRTLRETHAIAEAVHDRIEKAFPDVKHIMVHVNPDEE